MKYRINLVNEKKERTLDRVIYFALNYLRYILVVTQIVVIGVFFYRFKIDQEIVDLQDSISQKREIIQVSQPLIQEAKNSAYKLNRATSIISSQDTALASIDYILSIFPEKFFLKSLDIAKNSLSIDGVTQDFQSIRSFLNRLKKEAKFKNIELTNIKKTDQGLEFSFKFDSFNRSKSL